MAVGTDKQETDLQDFKNNAKCPKEDKNGVENEVSFDDILSLAGKFGRYQLFLFFSTLPFYVYAVFVYYSQLFMTEASPNHWCWIPELDGLSDIERRTLAIPLDENSRYGYSQCHAYVANWSEVLLTGQTPNHTWDTQPCQHGWEFDSSEIPYPTITSDLGWVCERSSYQATAQAIFFVGSVIGGFIIGWIADRFGRLPAAIVSNLIGCVAGVGSTFARNFIEFATCRFFTGMAYDNCMMMTYLLVLEYVAPKYRTMIANTSFGLFYGTTVTVLPWIALACGHWKIFSLVTSLPLGLVVLAPLFLPESPRWLMSRGRIDDAIKKLEKIGRTNRKEIPSKLIEQLRSSASNAKEEETKSGLELLKRPLLRKIFICICIEYMCCMIVFDALVRSIGQLNFDFFVSFSVVSCTEIPSLFLLAFVMDWMGRRWLTIVVMTVSCTFSILTAFVGGGLPSVICAIVARFAVNMSVNASMQWAAEMLPVSVRGSGISIVHVCGYLAAILSPYIVYLEIYISWLPLVLVGFVALIGAVSALFLPETAHKDMPHSFEDAENLIKSQKFWDMPCVRRNKGSAGHDNVGYEM